MFVFGERGGVSAWLEFRLGAEKLYVLNDWLYPATGYTGAGFTYADVVDFVQTFSCGVAVDDAALKSGLTATLQLVMNDGTSEHVVCSQTYNLG